MNKAATTALEGFICPACLVDFPSPSKLQGHWVKFHSPNVSTSTAERVSNDYEDLHQIIPLRFVFLSLRQGTVWNKFVYAISSQLFEVFHSGLASKSGQLNIDFLLSSFCAKYRPNTAYLPSKRDPGMKYLYLTQTLQIHIIWQYGGWNFTTHQIQVKTVKNMAYCHF